MSCATLWRQYRATDFKFVGSFTSDQVSQLDQDASAALATIREWRNSFVPINRIPLDILSLIPTHLSSQEDRLCASFVCRHWRRTLLQRAELWSQLYLPMGEVYAKTLLERAKGSMLDIIVGSGVPASTTTLLSSRTGQIKSLTFPYNCLEDILMFSEANPERLPSLHTLRIFVGEDDSPDDLDTITPPSPLLFSNAVNLNVVCLNSDMDLSPSPRPFVFPNLVSLDLLANQSGSLHASRLLDFLEASPMLRTVHMIIFADISLEGVLQERVVVLPNVERFALTVGGGETSYGVAAHISCPSARHTSLSRQKGVDDVIPDEIFPDSVLWDRIVRQHSRSPVEEVILEIRTTLAITCKLIFRSADATLIELRFNATDKDEDGYSPFVTYGLSEAFIQAARTVRNHPQLTNIKRLHLRHDFRPTSPVDVAIEIGQLLESLNPLDELALRCFDLLPYLYPFLVEDDIMSPTVLPPVKGLTISHTMYPNDRECGAIVELAKSQHALGIPFERVLIRRERMFAGMAEDVFAGMEERLRPWVGSVECCHCETYIPDGVE
jgi:hypothetical protein